MLAFERHGRLAVAVPDLSHRHSVAIAHGQSGFQHQVIDAHPRSLIFFQGHSNSCLRFTEIGLCQLYLGHTAQKSKALIGRPPQGIQITSAEAQLQRIDRLAETDLLETYPCLREGICIQRSIMIEQGNRFLISGRIDNQLGIIRAAQLRGISGMETGR